MSKRGGLTADINLRTREDNLLSHGTAAERSYAEKDERILEQAHTIKNLQSHSKLLS